MKFDLGFGNSVCVREAFIRHCAPVHIGDMALREFDYPAYDGDPDLLKLTKDVIERQTGHSYKHVILTNGATGGVVLALRMYAQYDNHKYCITRNPPFYLRYPGMIEVAGLIQICESDANSVGKAVILTDIPSNPLGKLDAVPSGLLDPIVLDGVYYNRVYMSLTRHVNPRHDLLVGSYSKLLGLNGIRMGWAATNDDILAQRLLHLAKHEYCGLSVASTAVILQSLRGFDWDAFETSARAKLDDNRSEWSKLERFFGDQRVGVNGMFYYAPVDEACKALLEKSGITWTNGRQLGANDDCGRFNLGQDCQLIKTAVKTVLKNDQSE